MPTSQHFSQEALIDGLILAGGQSRRMGRNKAELAIHGRSLLHHHIAAMHGEVQTLWVAGSKPAEPVPHNTRFIDDQCPGFEGPLSGLGAAMQKSRAHWLWLTSCDSFGVDGAIKKLLWQAACEAQADIVHLLTETGPQPLLALVNTALAQDLSAFLQQGERSVLAWYRRQHTVTIAPENSAGLFCNINTPADFARLESKHAD